MKLHEDVITTGVAVGHSATLFSVKPSSTEQSLNISVQTTTA